MIRAIDGCGQMTEFVRLVDVQEECGNGPDVNGDGTVDFADVLAVLAAWDVP